MTTDMLRRGSILLGLWGSFLILTLLVFGSLFLAAFGLIALILNKPSILSEAGAILIFMGGLLSFGLSAAFLPPVLVRISSWASKRSLARVPQEPMGYGWEEVSAEEFKRINEFGSW